MKNLTSGSQKSCDDPKVTEDTRTITEEDRRMAEGVERTADLNWWWTDPNGKAAGVNFTDWRNRIAERRAKGVK